MVGFGSDWLAGDPRIAVSENSRTGLSRLDGHWPGSWLDKHQNHPGCAVLYGFPIDGARVASYGERPDAPQTGPFRHNL